ncbi:hypothetical protein KY331_04925 [Candidatus Woesearchaeota archaeon]|nr:hypothetical protein [Candidatus Woesearchaeota archaeon]
MDRQLINQELAKFGIQEDDYIGCFLDLFSQMPPEEAKTVRSVQINLDRSYPVENQPNLEGGIIVPEIHTDVLKITEQGEFLERMKKLVLGESYSRYNPRRF